MRNLEFRVFSHSTKKFLKVDSKLFKNGNKLFCGLEFFGGDEIRINYYWKDNDGEIFTYNVKDESEFAINQFTGLKDSKGNKIFEGDIIKILIPKRNRIVKFENGSFCFKDTSRFGDFNQDLSASLIDEYRIEVVGNIYENHELLGDLK